MENRSTELKLPAVVLAGGNADAVMASEFGVQYRAAVPIAGKMMAQHVIDALLASKHVTDVCLVGNIQCDGVAKTIPSAETLIENLIGGVKTCSDGASDRKVLVATSDIPLVAPAAIDDLIERCTESEADFYYPIIPKEANEKRFPGMRRTYAKLSEGTFTGGNIFIMRAGFVNENADLIRDAFSARKSVMRLAKMVGFLTLIRAIMAQILWPGALDIRGLEKTAGRILNAKVKAVPTEYAEIGADVDDLEQVRFAESILGAL